MGSRPWNHNIHYHDEVLRSVPPGCGRALDVGCGEGLLTRRLAACCGHVTGIDVDSGVLARARGATAPELGIDFIEGDLLTHPFPDDSFDFITAVAALHHLPLRAALARFRRLLRPGGVLTVIGLFRVQSVEDYIRSAIAFPASWILRCLRTHAEVTAPVQDPRETLAEIRTACDAILPGAVLQRRLLFRYSLIWRKP